MKYDKNRGVVNGLPNIPKDRNKDDFEIYVGDIVKEGNEEENEEENKDFEISNFNNKSRGKRLLLFLCIVISLFTA